MVVILNAFYVFVYCIDITVVNFANQSLLDYFLV
jgi:hypothetical protein